jgi:hypothetical protein
MTIARYTIDDFRLIVRGYRMLDSASNGALSVLLSDVYHCRSCMGEPRPVDRPSNFLVRPLPLAHLADSTSVANYFIRLKRDDTFLRQLLTSCRDTASIHTHIRSARFSVGLLPWLDFSMLHRTTASSALMVVGIDFKNLSAFLANRADHAFPLDCPVAPTNVWGPTWQRFWSNLLQAPYDDISVSDFLCNRGVYFTNSVLCFGGGNNPRSHSYRCAEHCRPHIERQISIVRPQALASFGALASRNLSTLLLKYNPDCAVLRSLAVSKHPLHMLQDIGESGRRELRCLCWESYPIAYFPLYQPAWSQIAPHRKDYSELRAFLGIGK